MEASLEEYRSEIREWLETNTPPDWRDHLQTSSEEQVVDFYRAWTRELHEAGHLVPHWPKRWGGQDLGFLGQVVKEQEFSRADAPRPRPLAISLGHAAATLMEHGSPEQQQLIDAILDGAIFCQGFSEPEAGSDLASLRTRAVRRDDGTYVVNGQKTWSSFARYAQWCLLLARTDPDAPKHKGITFFLLDMTTPGITVRPIRQATGSAEFCELFFDDVVVPEPMRIGAEGDGWKIAQTTLLTERAVQMLEQTENLRRSLGELVGQSRRLRGPDGTPLGDDPGFRREAADIGIDIEALAALTERALASAAATGQIGPDSSVLKVFFSELLQRFTRLATEAHGMDQMGGTGEPREVGFLSGHWFVDHLRSWTWTISAGTNEIQRNIIAERVLGLPREGRS
ncbi:acyl-CoA dehydrogenase family protein [Streptomyces sp. UG1]|uniref:acyl-CoA dehydrogenase family protein n=1 Tax=Streptomyces sp. UG1 TaxID=3417652 RepID=UPI003CF8C104